MNIVCQSRRAASYDNSKWQPQPRDKWQNVRELINDPTARFTRRYKRSALLVGGEEAICKAYVA